MVMKQCLPGNPTESSSLNNGGLDLILSYNRQQILSTVPDLDYNLLFWEPETPLGCQLSDRGKDLSVKRMGIFQVGNQKNAMLRVCLNETMRRNA